MIKKLDQYLILNFIVPFFFILNILFFLFSIQFAFQKISNLVGKSLTLFQILKILFYLGTTTIPMMIPVSILLSSIMCFGKLGEQFELCAMKSAGISLIRIMLPIFILSILISIGLFFISNNILPENHKRAKNLLFNAINANPSLRFTSGQFNNDIPGFTIRINEIYGKKFDSLKQILIHKQANAYQDQTTIIAKFGTIRLNINKSLLKFKLYDGIIYDTQIESIENYKERLRQPNRTTKFTQLSIYIDISKFINKKLDEENIQEHFEFYKYNKLIKIIDSLKKVNDSITFTKAKNNFRNISMTNLKFDSSIIDFNKKITPIANWIKFDNIKKINILKNIVKEINEQLTLYFIPDSELIMSEKKNYAKIVIHQQRIITFSIMSIIFFIIGSSLGSIIKKGGVGIPMILAMIIFIIWFLIFTLSESESKLGNLNPYLAAWLPNLILLPLGIFLTKKALEDSILFDYNKCKKLFTNLIQHLSIKKISRRLNNIKF